MKEILFIKQKKIDLDQIRALYEDAGWSTYTQNFDCLAKGIDQSLLIISAWRGGELVGLVRVVGDGFTIVYIQDLLVRKTEQRKKIGTQLARMVQEEFSHVRQMVLIADDSGQNTQFYRSIGFVPVGQHRMTAFIRS
jgi:ribosomal protein S18 acetylase RimI-like enzyme